MKIDNVKLAQGNIFPGIRFLARKYLNISFVKAPLKIIFNSLVDVLAKLKNLNSRQSISGTGNWKCCLIYTKRIQPRYLKKLSSPVWLLSI